MADVYELSVASAAVAVTGGGVFAEILNTGAATNPRMKITEIDVFWATGAATNPFFGIGRPGNTPTTGTTVVGGALDPPAPAAFGATCVTGWGTAPTIPSKFFRQAAIASAGGNGVIWTWPQGQELIVPPNDRSKSVILWCTSLAANTSTTVNVTIRWSE